MILLAVAPLQTLGISHSYVSLTWICGPIAGFVVSVFFFIVFSTVFFLRIKMKISFIFP
jgi:hypothetical protein